MSLCPYRRSQCLGFHKTSVNASKVSRWIYIFLLFQQNWTRTILPAFNPCLGLYNQSYWEDQYLKFTTESPTTTKQECPTSVTVTTAASTFTTTETAIATSAVATANSTEMSTQMTTEQLQVVLARIEKQLRLYPPGTSAFRRNMHSYQVNDYISAIMGWVAVGIMCFIFVLFLCIDRERLVKDFFGGVQPEDSRV